jgi:hypothetical protein
MRNDHASANYFIMKWLPDPNRQTIRELEDLLIRYAAAVAAPVRKRAARQVDPTRDPEDVIGDAIR